MSKKQPDKSAASKKQQTAGARKAPGGKKEAKLQQQVEDLQQQVEQLSEDLKRERADFMNYKRRSELDRMQVMQVAKTDVIMQVLPIFDDLERALSAIPEDIADHSWAQGVSQVYRQVQSRLTELDVERIECVDQPFDPELHEAVGFDDGGGTDEVVIEELRPGYKLGEQVLRPSMVKVGKPDRQSETSNDGEANESIVDEEEEQGG